MGLTQTHSANPCGFLYPCDLPVTIPIPIYTHTHEHGYGFYVGVGMGRGQVTHGLPVMCTTCEESSQYHQENPPHQSLLKTPE
jgi:hypothetical protein